MNSKLNLASRVDSETETDSSKYVAKEYNRCTDKVKNTLKQEIYHFYFHLTHILEISRFEVPISRFFWALFSTSPDLHVLEVGRSAPGFLATTFLFVTTVQFESRYS